MNTFSSRWPRARRTSRRPGAGLAALAAIASFTTAACGSEAEADSDLDKVTLQFQIPENGIFAGFWYGKAEGIYAEHGIDLVIEPGVSSQASADAVARGTVDFSTSSFPSIVLNQQAGAPIVGLAEVIRGGNQGLLVGADTGIETWEDLPGKSVIITTGSSQKPLYDAALEATGVDPDSVEVVNVNPNVINQTFAAKEADGVLTLFPFTEPLLEGQREVKQLSVSDAGVQMPGFFLISSEEYVADNADLTERFVEATLQSWAAAYANQSEAVDALLAENPVLNEDDAGAVFAAFAEAGCGVDDNGTWFGDFTEAELEGGLDTLVGTGMVAADEVDLAGAFPRTSLDALPVDARHDCADLGAGS